MGWRTLKEEGSGLISILITLVIIVTILFISGKVYVSKTGESKSILEVGIDSVEEAKNLKNQIEGRSEYSE